MTDHPSWDDLFNAEMPDATRLAQRIHEREFRGKPLGTCIVALALLLAKAISEMPVEGDLDGLVETFIRYLRDSSGDKPQRFDA